MEFKCSEEVLYQDTPAIVIGKRYGHWYEPNVGRMYDVKKCGEVFKDVPEKELKKISDNSCVHVATSMGGAMRVWFK